MSVFVQPAYGVEEIKDGMATLRALFPDAEADDLNFVIFSTSGTHGSYLTIEDVERSIETDEPSKLTVLVVQPRVVRMLYGNIEVEAGDIEFLKKLRGSSASVMEDLNGA